MIGKMIVLERDAYQTFMESQKASKYSRATLVMVGVMYGVMAVMVNLQFLSGFNSLFLGLVIAPLLLIALGLLTAVVTKFGLTLLLWAGARAFGGPGRMKEVNQIVSISLLPGLLSAPILMEVDVPNLGLILVIIGLFFGIGWMYLICVRIIETTQQFSKTKAYLSVLASFVFFTSVYYLVLPVPTL
ncbi:YIP1 family protein [Salicibibacter cibarius]|uniref:YIP1 family protein n=1 Tax=Salicibibacter cibarius TaxID=2743000 RepID=A0A7T7CAK5_9BACI|nr:YIP1 family protein [Salicibibacter cibarius]QQK74999.1 YIP1 family protein [Salicibibacter cibarius]